jgi:hypothetical protein
MKARAIKYEVISMNIALHPGNHFQAERVSASSVMDFRTDYCDHEPMINSPALRSEAVAPRPRHLKIVGTHIDLAFGQVDVLWQLDRKTLERMATDKNTPVVVLEKLSTHPIAQVRAAVSDNENTPLYTVWALSKDIDADVRYQLAENHNLPQSLIRSLTSDENPYVACRAQDTYERLHAI